MWKSVEEYLDFLSKPHPELGYAICPYLKQYSKQIQIVKVSNIKQLRSQLHTICGILNAVGMEAAVLHGFKCSYDRLHDIIDTYQQRYKRNNITLLGMHPNTEDSPLGIEYNYTEPLIIVQKSSTLKRARTQLKSSKYYDNWNE
jgi:hypothetical protein